MRCHWIKQRGLLGLLLSFLLVCFSATASISTSDISTSKQFSDSYSSAMTITISDINHSDTSELNQNDLQTEQRSPAKSLAPDLGSMLRNGSLLPDRLHNSAPTYELVFEFITELAPTFSPRYKVTPCHWRDWTRNASSSQHRIAGWKESNLLFRFISQADA